MLLLNHPELLTIYFVSINISFEQSNTCIVLVNIGNIKVNYFHCGPIHFNLTLIWITFLKAALYQIRVMAPKGKYNFYRFYGVYGFANVGLSVSRQIRWFPLILFIFHLQIGHDQQITPIDFGVIRSKVKVTVTLNVRMVSTEYYQNYLSLSFHISQDDLS